MKLTAKASVLLVFTLLTALLAPALAQAATAKLTVSKSGSGSGTVTSSPAGINCGATCSANFTKSARVKLTAAATTGSTFIGWSGACTGTASTCTVTMSAAKTVTASFAPVPVQLTVSKSGNGAGAITSSPAGINCGATCSANFNKNASVTLTAAATAGSTFSGWSGACTGLASTCTVPMTQAQTVGANFTLTPLALTITTVGTGTGTITSTPSGINCGVTCTASFNPNSSITLTAVASAGSTFSGWSGACTGSASTCTVPMTQAQTVTANFSLIQLALTVTKAGTGAGTITSAPVGIDCGATCIASFNPNSSVTLTAVASAGSTFSGWSGACTGSASTCTVPMTQAQTVTANFSLIQLALTVTKAGTGAGTIISAPVGIDCGATCVTNFNQNSAVTLTATAATGSTFGGWSGACTGSASTCTLTMSQAQTVTANFSFIPLTLTITSAGSGTGTITSTPSGISCGTTCTANFTQNTAVTLTLSPTTGSTFVGWSGACTGTASTCIVTMNQAQAVTANFSLLNTTQNISTYRYDPSGNLTQVTDPLGHMRQIQYDSLDQPITHLEPHPTVTGSTLGQIDMAYDSLGQVTRITDPRNVATDYQLDNLGNLLSQTSPDTGVTLNTYDDAGNLKTRTDARGKLATYSYDSQNRVTQVVYDDQTLTTTWDNCANGIGRVCSLATAVNSLNLAYDLHGRITGKNQTVGSVTLNLGNSYNASGQLQQTTTASGQTIGYVWLNDRLETITVNGQPLITQILYEPDGQVGGWTWSNGTSSERQYDLAGRPVAISLGFDGQSLLSDTRNYSYDAASRITGISDDIAASLDQAYTYDGLDRLTSSQQGAFTFSRFDYAYDLSGNRTSKVLNNGLGETHSIDPASNRLQQQSGVQTVNYRYDPAGNLLRDGNISYGYNSQGRRSSATASNLNAAYSYNALGERVSKTVNGATTLFVYDQQGRLAGEYDSTGQLLQEIIWLGDLPIAALKPTTQASATIDLYYVHGDHLGTPRKITRPGDNKVLWTWESEAFGNSLPNQNPSGLGAFVFNLRFPGQYYDQETGLSYNGFRDYDLAKGRYIESDPIGLAGGINTYTYVSNNPLRYIDPLGLTQRDIDVARQLAMETQPDLKFPDTYKEADLGSDAAITIANVGTRLNSRYWEKLNNDVAADLLDTIIHEAIHFTYPDPKDFHNQENDTLHTGYPYDEAARRTTTELMDKFNQRRKIVKPKKPKKCP